MSDIATETSGTKKGSKAPEKPIMAAKKEFVLGPIEYVDEVPTPTRVNTQARLPLGLDEMLEGFKAKKKPPMRFVPIALWQSRDIPADKITAANCKDRLRRAFYSWQGKDEGKAKYTLAFSDQADTKGKYTGVNMYLVLKPN